MARILVIDDQRQIRDNCREALEDAGHTVMVAADGQEGVGLYHQDPVDLVILDLYMPKLDGLATIQTLRNSLDYVREQEIREREEKILLHRPRHAEQASSSAQAVNE